MPNYRPVNHDQGAFIAVWFDRQVLPNSFEYAQHYLLEHQVDLSAFEVYCNNELAGARAYYPRVSLKIVLFAYSRGILGSRRVEAACRENVTFMALAPEAKPDHVTIAAFVTRSYGAIASKERSSTLKEPEDKVAKLEWAVARMLEAHRQADSDVLEEDEPKHQSRQIDELQAQAEKIRTFLQGRKPRCGANGEERQRNLTDNESAKLATGKGVIQDHTGEAISDAMHQIIVEAQAQGAPQVKEALEGGGTRRAQGRLPAPEPQPQRPRTV